MSQRSIGHVYVRVTTKYDILNDGGPGTSLVHRNRVLEACGAVEKIFAPLVVLGLTSSPGVHENKIPDPVDDTDGPLEAVQHRPSSCRWSWSPAPPS